MTRLMELHFARVTTMPFTVSRLVPRAELWSCMVQSIYGLDAIADDEGTRIVAHLDLPDPVRWTLPMLQVDGRASV